MLLGSNTQFRWGSKRVLPQRLWIRLSIQLLQSLHSSRWNVSCWRDKRNVPDQSFKAIVDVKRIGIMFSRTCEGFNILLVVLEAFPLFDLKGTKVEASIMIKMNFECRLEWCIYKYRSLLKIGTDLHLIQNDP